MSTTPTKEQRLWQIVNAIPYGQVASYGQLAALAGVPRGARWVGTVLKKLPTDTILPWHRVVSSRGTIAFPVNSKAFQRQYQRLVSEGIQWQGNRIPMQRYQWVP